MSLLYLVRVLVGDADEPGFLESMAPKALRLLGFDDEKRALLEDGIIWVVRRTRELDQRSRRIEDKLDALAARLAPFMPPGDP